MYEYRAEVLEVRDGDTLVARVDLGFDVFKRMPLRLKDVYCYELDSHDEVEKQKANWAKDFVIQTLKDGDLFIPITVRTYKTRTGRDKMTFDRYVADVSFQDKEGEWKDLGKLLIDGGLATKTPTG